ncbi:MAG: hypothetical protein ACE5FL_08730 [Myxococcota bacterium]
MKTSERLERAGSALDETGALLLFPPRRRVTDGVEATPPEERAPG